VFLRLALSLPFSGGMEGTVHYSVPSDKEQTSNGYGSNGA
jgi:hypothetical protein